MKPRAFGYFQRVAAFIGGTQREAYLKKLLVFLGATVLGWVGWWLGSFVGVMSAFMLSMVGTGAGMYVGARVAQEYLE